MSGNRGLSSSDPFWHLRRAGMERLSDGQERALLEELLVDLWEPPGGLLRHKAATPKAHVILGGFRVYDIVPRRFQAYARVVHPLQRRPAADGTPVGGRWTDVVDSSAGTVDGDVRSARGWPAAARLHLGPLIGVLDRSTAVSLAEVLKRHTATRKAVYFLFWGGLAEFGNAKQDAVYQAPIEVVGALYPYGGQEYLSPMLWWDAAGEWFVATHPDSSSTYIGGSRQLVRELSNSQKMEVVVVQPQTFVDVAISGRPE